MFSVCGGCFDDCNSDVETAWDSPSASGRTVKLGNKNYVDVLLNEQ